MYVVKGKLYFHIFIYFNTNKYNKINEEHKIIYKKFLLTCFITLSDFNDFLSEYFYLEIKEIESLTVL